MCIGGVQHNLAGLRRVRARQAAPDFHGREIQFLGHEAEVYEKSVGPAVDVRGHGDAARLADALHPLGQRQVGGADEQGVQLLNDLIVLVHDQLVSKKRGFVLLFGQMRCDLLTEGHGGVHVRKIAEQMHFLAGGDLHAGNQGQPVGVAACLGCRQVQACIVIGQGNHVQSLERSHAAEIGGRHVVAAAGGQTGVHVQVSEQGFHRSGPAGNAGGVEPAADFVGCQRGGEHNHVLAYGLVQAFLFHVDAFGQDHAGHFRQNGHGHHIHVRLYRHPGHAFLTVGHDPGQKITGIPAGHFTACVQPRGEAARLDQIGKLSDSHWDHPFSFTFGLGQLQHLLGHDLKFFLHQQT